MEILLAIPLLVSFFLVVFIMPHWIKKAKKFGFTGKDMNKHEKRSVAEGGGLVVLVSFLISVLVYVALRTFYFKAEENVVEIFALTTSILLLAGIGLIDGALGWKMGLRRRTRVFLCIFAAIPLMVINAGDSQISVPLISGINLLWIYPFLIIPLGIVGTSTTFNFLAGYNGLEAGQGVLVISALSLVAYLTGSSWLALIGLCMVVALLAFLIFNKFPAKVFPGDVLTYPVGGLIAIMAILGNMERVALFFFIPYILEVGLKLRGNLKKESFGKPNKDGSLEMPYDKIYGLEHFAIWTLKKSGIKSTEKNVVYLIWAMQIVFIAAGFVIFSKAIFF